MYKIPNQIIGASKPKKDQIPHTKLHTLNSRITDLSTSRWLRTTVRLFKWYCQRWIQP